MKIKTKTMTFDKAMAQPRPKHRSPKKPNLLLTTVVRLAAIPEMIRTGFTYTKTRMELVGDRPALILMNHSSFLDLKIASKIFYPKPYCIVCTTDGFVGKSGLMRHLGCIPTQKFVSDFSLINDMDKALKGGNSVLMYPEAGYSFDGTATALPNHLGQLLKHLKVPVVTVITHGAFAYDPLYNGLQKRKVKVTAEVNCLFTPEEIETKTVEELDEALTRTFTFDNFAWQYDNEIHISEPFRADGLNRILYQCPHCQTEGKMVGKGVKLTCHACGKEWELTSLGKLEDTETGEVKHIPDWYLWQRSKVREEILAGKYRLDLPVKVALLVDYRALDMIGEGRLIHDENGFTLTGCDGKLEYRQKPLSSYTLNSDYFWYEIGDVISIGNRDCLYYCFPQVEGDVVTKARLATEELFKIIKERRAEACRARKAAKENA